jgi:hypothetical protein
MGEFGTVGAFHKLIKRGALELEKHKGKVTRLSVNRWKHETNEPLLDDANKFFDLMYDYTEHWGYER